MARTIQAVFRHVLLAAALLGFAGPAAAEDYFYAIEVNGVLVGYARLATSPLAGAARPLTLLTHELVVRGTLLGAKVDNRILLTYHVDPKTGTFTYHESRIEQGQTVLTSAVRIDGRTARVSDGRGGPETPVDLPDGVVLATSFVQAHLLADFVAGGATERTYRLFDGRDNAVREMQYTKTGAETLELAGRRFETLVLAAVDRRTGVTLTLWLDTRTGIVVQTRQPGNARAYLAGPSVVAAVAHAGSGTSLDPLFLAKTNVSIPAIRRISYMKVRAVAQPSGVWLTPDALNVPGQRFNGTVKDNRIEGVFEVEHRRYDGAGAPPFPPALGADPALSRWLDSDEYIQANDPELREKAREITRGSRDAWEAARRLSAWVAAEIKGAIPGGVTARGTYDQRAGECGGHSFLMAALSRSVGIPARVVWGCLYVTNDGGAFGQHAWNEVYMGGAGWIPLDTTAGEIDYVDSGHIRIGVVQSISTRINMQTMEVLDHRVAPRPGSQTPAPAKPAGVTLDRR